MEFGDLMESLGILTALFFGLAILNYFVKLVNKKFINNLGKDKKPMVDLYRKIMKLIIKNHKIFGVLAVVALLAHFFIGFASNSIKITGIIAAVLLVATFSLGVYGAFINKNKKGVWLKIHRIVPFILILAIGLHVL